MRRLAVSYLFACALAACSFDPRGQVDAGDDDDATPLDAADGMIDPDAMIDASIDAMVDAMIDAPIDAMVDAPIDAMPCVPGCTGSDLITCPGGPGGPPMTTTCGLGCDPTPTAHCAALVPSNLTLAQSTALLTTATGAVNFAPNEFYLLFTDTGEIWFDITETSHSTFRAGGDMVNNTRYDTSNPTMAVFAMSSLSLPANSALFAVGRRPVLFLVRGDVTLGGLVDFSPGCVLSEGYTLRCAGPGGGDGGRSSGTPAAATGCAPGAAGTTNPGDDTGGAGGGFATSGAAAGAGGTTPMPSGLGACGGDTLIPLRGGGGGGAGSTNGGAWGGGGGGAIQITSTEGAISLVGTSAVLRMRIDVGGAGGKGTLASSNSGGGGGGAGGGILLEARSVSMNNVALIAGGGGGGGGRTVSDGTMFTLRDGESAQSDATAAAGGEGDGSGNNQGRGGNGAITGTPATAGEGGQDGTGGGGGGLGRIRINTRDGGFAIPAGNATSGSYTAGVIARE